jgi:pimeloyl-ACP methyl ester carboxylesterase
MWTAQVHAFRRHFKVIAYDLLGHGQSPRVTSSATFDDYVGQLARVVAEIAGGRAMIVGFSFGGLIALGYAAAYPGSVRKLMLMSTVCDRSPDERRAVLDRLAVAGSEGLEATLEAALGRWFSASYRHDHPKSISDLRQRFLANDKESFLAAYRIFATADAALVGRLGQIGAPTLALTGELDTGSTPQMARRMADAIPGAAYSIIPAGRHMMAMELAATVNEVLVEFAVQSHRETEE